MTNHNFHGKCNQCSRYGHKASSCSGQWLTAGNACVRRKHKIKFGYKVDQRSTQHREVTRDQLLEAHMDEKFSTSAEEYRLWQSKSGASKMTLHRSTSCPGSLYQVRQDSSVLTVSEEALPQVQQQPLLGHGSQLVCEESTKEKDTLFNEHESVMCFPRESLPRQLLHRQIVEGQSVEDEQVDQFCLISTYDTRLGKQMQPSTEDQLRDETQQWRQTEDQRTADDQDVFARPPFKRRRLYKNESLIHDVTTIDLEVLATRGVSTIDNRSIANNVQEVFDAVSITIHHDQSQTAEDLRTSTMRQFPPYSTNDHLMVPTRQMVTTTVLKPTTTAVTLGITTMQSSTKD